MDLFADAVTSSSESEPDSSSPSSLGVFLVVLGSSEVLGGDEEVSPAKYQLPATEDRPLRGPVMGTSVTLSGILKKA